MTKRSFVTASFDSQSGLTRDEQKCVPWWSFTKTVLATAALKLVAQDRLNLDELIADRSFTLRQLLQHRAGLTDYGKLPAYHEAVQRGDKPWSTERLLKETSADKLEYQPGHGWRYSNIGYLFVRQIIEQVSDENLDDALRVLIFDPLGLDKVRLVHTPKDLEETKQWYPENYNPGWVYHDLLVGRPADATIFLHRLMMGDILPGRLLTQMTTAHQLGGPLPGRPWLTTGYGLGLMIGQMAKAGLATGHSGGGPNSICAVYHFADRAVPRTVASFCKGDDEGMNEHEIPRLANPV